MRLLMVYNADGGLLNGALDLAHKLVSPQTYACKLCEVSHGWLGMRREWRDHVAGLPLPVVFHHRDDFAAAYPGADVDLPAILLDRDGALEPLIGPVEFSRVDDLGELMAMLDEKLARSL